MFEKIFKRASWTDVIISVIFVVFGILLMTNAKAIVSMLSIILGGIFVAIGIFKIIEYISQGKEDNYLIGLGAAAILGGIVIMFATGIILTLSRIIIGLWMLYTAIMNLQTSAVWKDFQSRLWLATVIGSVLTLIAGIYILANSGAILEGIGFIIVLYGLVDIFERLVFIKNVDNYMDK